MVHPVFTLTPSILTAVEQRLSRILGYLQAAHLPAVAVQEILTQVEAEIVHASTAIEGNTLTQEQVLARQAVPALPRDTQEVMNCQAALA